MNGVRLSEVELRELAIKATNLETLVKSLTEVPAQMGARDVPLRDLMLLDVATTLRKLVSHVAALGRRDDVEKF